MGPVRGPWTRYRRGEPERDLRETIAVEDRQKHQDQRSGPIALLCIVTIVALPPPGSDLRLSFCCKKNQGVTPNSNSSSWRGSHSPCKRWRSSSKRYPFPFQEVRDPFEKAASPLREEPIPLRRDPRSPSKRSRVACKGNLSSSSKGLRASSKRPALAKARRSFLNNVRTTTSDVTNRVLVCG
jgi:hypothetical protein